MAEYTDLSCNSPAIAEAVKAYLENELTSIEEIDRPSITAIVNKSTLRIAYHDQDCHRADWDMQLLGYRDGFTARISNP